MGEEEITEEADRAEAQAKVLAITVELNEVRTKLGVARAALRFIADDWDHVSGCPCDTEELRDTFQPRKYGRVNCMTCDALEALEATKDGEA